MGWEKLETAETETTLASKIVVFDELAEFLSNLPRNKMRLGDELRGNFASIAQLGRAAHIHLLLATQSASGDLFPSTLKNNIQFRNICGRVDATISRMAIDTEEGESLPDTPGSYLGWMKGKTLGYQGYWPGKTVDVLKLGTMKPGFDPNTGLKINLEDDVDFSKPPEMPTDVKTDTKDTSVTSSEEPNDKAFDMDGTNMITESQVPDLNTFDPGIPSTEVVETRIDESVEVNNNFAAVNFNEIKDETEDEVNSFNNDKSQVPKFSFNVQEVSDVEDDDDNNNISTGSISIIE